MIALSTPRSLLCACLLLLATSPIRAQATPVDVNPADAVAPYADTIRSIVRASLADGRAYDLLADLVEVAPHRLAGSPGGMAAIEWARQTMSELGLENVHLEEVEVPHWERGSVCSVHIVEPPQFAGETLPALALGGSVATPELGLTAELVIVDSLDAVDALGTGASGRIVLYNGPLDPTHFRTFEAYGGAVGQRVHGASRAARHGAVATLVRSMTTRRDDVPHTGGMRYAPDLPRIPTAAVSTLAAERLAQIAATGERVVVHFRQDPSWHDPAPSFNVVGEVVGRELPDEIVLVGGHLDCWDVGQGAHDDGGGCCQALEAARLMLSLDLRPRRTIRVVLFANEENGLAGGRGYREAHVDELPDHVLALESDSGVFTPRGFQTNANPEARVVLAAITDLLAEAGAGELIDGSGGADIGPLKDDGVVLVGYMPDSQRYFDLHHTNEDTLDKVNPREINLGAGVIAALLYVVADLETRLAPNPAPDEDS